MADLVVSGLPVTATILAHQGGWDEILLVVTPILLIVLALRLAKRRLDAAPADPADPAEQTGHDAGDASDITPR
jgi:hypothetical protein